MARFLPRVRRPVAVFFVSVFVLLAAFVAGIGALHYEFFLAGTGVDAMRSVVEVYDYGALPAADRAAVDAAIAGERFVYASVEPVPGYGAVGLGEQIGVVRDGTTYVFARQLFFDATAPLGLLSLSLGVLGAALFVYAVRLDMTSRR
ncbi:hypothetical protein U3A55_12320 [Salarchaeum sp. III]|uniref:hypothetical protein n=1 Tax=Salarchaeum sp. III TaxID=3107927 RepID=UPI002EDB835B